MVLWYYGECVWYYGTVVHVYGTMVHMYGASHFLRAFCLGLVVPRVMGRRLVLCLTRRTSWPPATHPSWPRITELTVRVCMTLYQGSYSLGPDRVCTTVVCQGSYSLGAVLSALHSVCKHRGGRLQENGEDLVHQPSAGGVSLYACMYCDV